MVFLAKFVSAVPGHGESQHFACSNKFLIRDLALVGGGNKIFYFSHAVPMRKLLKGTTSGANIILKEYLI